MTPVDALIAATSRGHDLMGMDGHGVVQQGAVADLLLVRGDPTEDIMRAADKRFHVAVLRNGDVVAGALPA
ncbi:Uncharacterised protein [Achromobacter xylosoxidans]|nr:Uncharacterised protein [Achromobacter xylosoxidans]